MDRLSLESIATGSPEQDSAPVLPHKLFLLITMGFTVNKRTYLASAAAAAVVLLSQASAHAVTTTFFDPAQTAALVATGTTSDTISSEGYLFTYTLDKLFTGGTGTIIGRSTAVNWPDGVQAQSVTAGLNPSKAQITIKRVDGTIFDVTTFTAKLLASTSGAGNEIEVVPQLNGEDTLNDPVVFGATGYYGQSFTYGGNSTRLLSGADTYTFTLIVDFALTGLTLVDASAPPIPEAETYAMMLAGLGLVGGAVARRRRHAEV